MYVLDGVAELAKTVILKAFECHFLAQTRSWMDTNMAVYANVKFKIECLDCKKTGCWEPYPEETEKEKLDVKKIKNQVTL